jgi:hypothetical protein
MSRFCFGCGRSFETNARSRRILGERGPTNLLVVQDRRNGKQQSECPCSIIPGPFGVGQIVTLVEIMITAECYQNLEFTKEFMVLLAFK